MENRIHPSVDDIYRSLSSDYPTLSKTTVYNSVWLFVEKGAIVALDIDKENVRFDFSESYHAHFMCRCCGRIHDVVIDRLPEVSEMDECVSDLGVPDIYYKGICGHCKEMYEKLLFI